MFSKGIMSNGHSDRFMNRGQRFACSEFELTLMLSLHDIFPICSQHVVGIYQDYI